MTGIAHCRKDDISIDLTLKKALDLISNHNFTDFRGKLLRLHLRRSPRGCWPLMSRPTVHGAAITLQNVPTSKNEVHIYEACRKYGLIIRYAALCLPAYPSALRPSPRQHPSCGLIVETSN